jgi:hypothetical protein
VNLLPEEKVRENFLRRQAKRLNLNIQKSRAKKWSIDNQGGYMVTDGSSNAARWGLKYELGIDDVEKLLDEYEESLKAQKTE